MDVTACILVESVIGFTMKLGQGLIRIPCTHLTGPECKQCVRVIVGCLWCNRIHDTVVQTGMIGL